MIPVLPALTIPRYRQRFFLSSLPISPLIITPLWWRPYPIRVSSYLGLGNLRATLSSVGSLAKVFLGCVSCVDYSALVIQNNQCIWATFPFTQWVSAGALFVSSRLQDFPIDIFREFEVPHIKLPRRKKILAYGGVRTAVLKRRVITKQTLTTELASPGYRDGLRAWNFSFPMRNEEKQSKIRF